MPAADTSSVTGRVRVAGSTPFVQVLIEPADSAATAVEVRGDLRAELARLQGARVEARGVRSDSAFLVSEYRVLEIAGHAPLVGTLEIVEARVVLHTAAGPRELSNVPAALRDRPGAKVWVIVDDHGEVSAYGILRER
jgi:hypothetical protein